jgi:hypothetical protein
MNKAGDIWHVKIMQTTMEQDNSFRSTNGTTMAV